MPSDPHLRPLIDHLVASSTLSVAEAQRLVREVVNFFDETPEAFVARRHGELKANEGLTNEAIYTRIAAELGERSFASPALSLRQIRRIIYG